MALKVIVPMAGIGTRLRPHTLYVPKALINVAGKKIIDYIIDTVNSLDIEEFIFVIGHLGHKVEEYLNEAYPKIKKNFVIQTHPRGLGHAISLAKDFISPLDEVLVILGDLIFLGNISDEIGRFRNVDGALAVMSVKDPHRYGVVVLDNDDKVKEVIEKPLKPPSNIAVAGIYYFKSASMLLESLSYIIQNDIRTKDEYQLTDAIMHMIKSGAKIRVFSVYEIFDCGNKENLIKANSILLSKFHTSFNFRLDIKDSIIIPPAYISPNATIERSIVGPYVSVYDGAVIVDSVIKESVIEEGAFVKGMVIEKSLIGIYSYVEETFRELNVGSHSEYKKTGEKR